MCCTSCVCARSSKGTPHERASQHIVIVIVVVAAPGEEGAPGARAQKRYQRARVGVKGGVCIVLVQSASCGAVRGGALVERGGGSRG